MMTLKNTFSAGMLLCISSFSCVAASSLPLDPNSGEVVFKQSFKLNATFNEDDAYAVVQGWFTQSADKFSRQNEDVSANAKKAETSNLQPLQSLDPESRRMTGKGVTKFYGGANSCINLLCMEYYVILEVKGQDLTATITKIKYHHYNRRTNSEKPIYTWEGGKPFESADKLESLVAKDGNRDVMSLTSFLNEDMVKLFGDLKGYLKNKNILADNTKG